ncbi:glycoside hydrolase family 13 protein [Acidipropionibacterium timonense]|uniref:glycoside hydrolase family 13 protein n=1 Tax=Acidipropionibacterium timonense TaxID=2161818 RepID=UPI00398C544B
MSTTPMSSTDPTSTTPTPDEPWWRSAVVYQIYPRSFADGNGDGVGDLRGIIDHLDHIVSLGVDAVWVSPWYPSPMVDGGYDVADYCDINPDFGTLTEAQEFLDAAHAQGLRVIIDLVPNHCSSAHPWFRAALAAGPGSPEREHFIFRDGRGEAGELPPNNWPSVFGGPAWTRVTEPDGRPGQWYLHFFDPGQPDWNWQDEEVRAEFDRVLRFWFDRGVDGFRVDVADALVKDMTLPDVPLDPFTGRGTLDKAIDNPMWAQPGLADVQRRWRTIANSYRDTPQGERMFVAEAYLPHDKLVRFLEPDRFQTSFDFEFLQSAWTASSMRWAIDRSLEAHARVHATSTWVLGNHDVIRPASRYGKATSGIDFTSSEHYDDLATKAMPADLELGRRRARAALLLEMALPGGAYVYQGEELGLDEVSIPDDLIQDPSWERSGHVERGRDGCRVPIPWSGEQAPYGWSTTSNTWLPMPGYWADRTVAAEEGDPDSFLSLYRRVLAVRRAEPALGSGSMTWDESDEQVLSFTREPGFRCVVNFGTTPVQLDPSRVIVSSLRLEGGLLPRDASAWLRV